MFLLKLMASLGRHWRKRLLITGPGEMVKPLALSCQARYDKKSIISILYTRNPFRAELTARKNARKIRPKLVGSVLCSRRRLGNKRRAPADAYLCRGFRRSIRTCPWKQLFPARRWLRTGRRPGSVASTISPCRSFWHRFFANGN